MSAGVESITEVKLFTVDDAKKVLSDLGVCQDTKEADAIIADYTNRFTAIMPTNTSVANICAAFWRVVDVASYTPAVVENFEAQYAVPFNRANLLKKLG